MTFRDFILSRHSYSQTARGDFIAVAKSWIGAGIFPQIVEQWSDLHRFLARQNATDKTIEEARKLWRGFKKAVPHVA